ncbi:hypothetical protein BR93DRAFT_884644 [Coniochaeta sp. PMI_546]|nr:hypothetical protein BR93DRAFT_884644 [Coniochaeta sp. PMI_546]
MSPPSTTTGQRLLAVIERPFIYARRAVRAAAYPLQGIYYFLRHPDFYPLFYSRLIPLSVISFLVYTALFFLVFWPQYLFLVIFHGWGAWPTAIILFLGEGLVIIQGLFEGFFVDECRVDVFDATLINHGLTDLVAPHRLLFRDAPNSVKMLGKPTGRAEYNPWSLIQIVELVVFLPLNLIPYVGAPAFIMITGTRVGKLSHHRWYQLRGLDKKQQKKEIDSRVWDYVWFGTVAMILELIPVLSFFFLLTTTTGSALWVAKMEQDRRAPQARPPGFEDHDVAAEYDGDAPPAYHDEPV